MTTIATQTGLISVNNIRLGNGRLTVAGDSMGVLAGTAVVKWQKKKKPIMAKYPAVPLAWEVVEEMASIKVTLYEHSGREVTKFSSSGPFAVVFTYIKPDGTEGTVTMANAVPGDELTKQFVAGATNVFDLEFLAVGTSPLIAFA